MSRKMFGVTVYSIEEISRETGISNAGLNGMCRVGTLRGKKIGREYWITKNDLEEFLGFEILEDYGNGSRNSSGNSPGNGSGKTANDTAKDTAKDTTESFTESSRVV